MTRRKRDKFNGSGEEKRGAFIGGMLQAVVNGGGPRAEDAKKVIEKIREDPDR